MISSKALKHEVRRLFNTELIRKQIRDSGEIQAWLVAETEGQVQGVGRRSRISNRHVEIAALNIDAKSHSTGLGRSLIDEMTRFAHSHDAIRQSVWVFKGNQKAVRFYDSLGFCIFYENNYMHPITRETVRLVRMTRNIVSNEEAWRIMEPISKLLKRDDREQVNK